MFAALGIILSLILIKSALKKPVLAFILLPVFCIFFMALGLWRDDESLLIQAMIFWPIFIVGTCCAVLMSRVSHEGSQWPRQLAAWILIVLITTLCLSLGLIFLSDAPAMGIFILIGFICVIGLIVAAINFQIAARRTNAAYVLSTINSSIKQNLPLPMALEAAAGMKNDPRSQALHRIHKWLVHGYSLGESIRKGYPKCPSYVMATIEAAERIGQIPKAVASLSKDLGAKSEQEKKIEPVSAFYPIVLFCIMSSIVWGLMVFVIPQIIAVIEEMNQSAVLPWATQFLIDIFEYVVFKNEGIFLTLLLCIVFIIIPLSIRVKFRPRRPDRPYLVSRIGDWIKWHMPISRWFANNHSLLYTIEMLKLSLEAEQPVNNSIKNALDLDLNGCFKKKLKNWLSDVERGKNISESARRSGLGSPLAWAFDDKVNQGNTLAILETLESFYRSNYSYRVNLARFIMWPCVTLGMALVVGFVVFAVYSGPIAMIYYTADIVYP